MFAKQNLKNFWVAKVFQLIHAQHLGREKKRLRSTGLYHKSAMLYQNLIQCSKLGFSILVDRLHKLTISN